MEEIQSNPVNMSRTVSNIDHTLCIAPTSPKTSMGGAGCKKSLNVIPDQADIERSLPIPLSGQPDFQSCKTYVHGSKETRILSLDFPLKQSTIQEWGSILILFHLIFILKNIIVYISYNCHLNVYMYIKCIYVYRMYICI